MPSPLTTGHLVRCPQFWPQAPDQLQQLGYLIPGPSDILRVLYVGTTRTQDPGWLYCCLVAGSAASDRPGHAAPHGWGPSDAVIRLRPPGRLWRIAPDGQQYPFSAWMDYYGETVGLYLWERAPGPRAPFPS